MVFSFLFIVFSHRGRVSWDYRWLYVFIVIIENIFVHIFVDNKKFIYTRSCKLYFFSFPLNDFLYNKFQYFVCVVLLFIIFLLYYFLMDLRKEKKELFPLHFKISSRSSRWYSSTG